MIIDQNDARIRKSSSGPDYPFPAPWFRAQCFGGFEFLPIETCADLCAESLNMRHCVAVYARQVAAGTLCAVSIRQSGAREATALLGRGLARLDPPRFGLVLGALRGYRSAKCAPEVEAAVHGWLHSNIET